MTKTIEELKLLAKEKAFDVHLYEGEFSHHETEYTFTETSIFELLQAQDPLQGELVALQKDKAEMIEYAENIVGALDAIMLFGTDINIAKEFAKMALETKKPKCMECME